MPHLTLRKLPSVLGSLESRDWPPRDGATLGNLSSRRPSRCLRVRMDGILRVMWTKAHLPVRKRVRIFLIYSFLPESQFDLPLVQTSVMFPDKGKRKSLEVRRIPFENILLSLLTVEITLDFRAQSPELSPEPQICLSPFLIGAPS